MFIFKVYCIQCYFQKTFRKILLFTLYYFLFSFGNISSLKLLFNSRKNKVYVCMYECVYIYVSNDDLCCDSLVPLLLSFCLVMYGSKRG